MHSLVLFLKAAEDYKEEHISSQLRRQVKKGFFTFSWILKGLTTDLFSHSAAKRRVCGLRQPCLLWSASVSCLVNHVKWVPANVDQKPVLCSEFFSSVMKQTHTYIITMQIRWFWKASCAIKHPDTPAHDSLHPGTYNYEWRLLSVVL